MADEIHTNNRTLRLMIGDITDIEVSSFVFYANHDLQLGSGYGTAISQRGGPSVQEELKQMGPLNTTDVVVSSAGEMKAEHIFHAVGPRFQEQELESKLKTTIQKTLKLADEKGISQIAFPAMGTGFFGIPLETSARVTINTIKDYMANNTAIKEFVICLLDKREYKPFKAEMDKHQNA